MHRMFGDRNGFGVRPNKWKDNKLYQTMMWRDHIEACTHAANTPLVWKHLNLSKKNTKFITSTDSQRLFSAASASHFSNEKRKGGCCWLLYDDWNCEMALNN